MQTTVAGCVRLQGIGLHSGRECRLNICPAEAGRGIIFRLVGDAVGIAEIPARHEFIASTAYRTELASTEGVHLSTVEHLMAALAVLGIDNAVVEVDGPEVPAMDGSALPFAEAILETGIRPVGGRRHAIRVLRQVGVDRDGSSVRLFPARDFRLACAIEFSSPAIGRQECIVESLGLPAVWDLLPARTFVELESVEKLRKMDLARGGSLENAVVVSGNKVLNENGLRFTDEFVLHKALDVVGDLYLAGAPILAHCVAERPGHGITSQLLSALFSTPGAWTWEEMPLTQPRDGAITVRQMESRPEMV